MYHSFWSVFMTSSWCEKKKHSESTEAKVTKLPKCFPSFFFFFFGQGSQTCRTLSQKFPCKTAVHYSIAFLKSHEALENIHHIRNPSSPLLCFLQCKQLKLGVERPRNKTNPIALLGHNIIAMSGWGSPLSFME